MTDDRVVALCARRLIPFMMALYVVNYIDRVNVGFAALTMNADLGFSDAAYGFGAGLFFGGYLLFQVPASIVLGRLRVRQAVSGILIVWGLLSASTALVRTPLQFDVLRFVLGGAEAGFYPLMLLYLTRWFPRSYRTRVTAMFMASIPLASLIGGPLSGSILDMNGVLGLAGWQWLFLLEGLPACVLGFAVYRFLPESPVEARWLSADDKRTIAARLAAEDIAQHHEIGTAFRDPRLLLLALVNFAILFSIYGVQLWLPLIVQGQGYSHFETGVISSLPYVVSLPAMILWGHASDRKDERVRHVAMAALFGAAGFFAASLLRSDVLSLAAITAALVGTLCMQPPFFALLASFLSGRAVAGGAALVISISNVGSFLGPGIVGVIRQQTGGTAAAMALFGVVLILAAVLVLAVGRAMARARVSVRSVI